MVVVVPAGDTEGRRTGERELGDTRQHKQQFSRARGVYGTRVPYGLYTIELDA